jgi:hypothetical protein
MEAADTKVLTTPKHHHKVTVRTWATGGDSQELEAVYKEGATMFSGEGIPAVKTIDAQNRAFELLILKIEDGDVKTRGKDVAARMRSMHLSDYNYVVETLDEILDASSISTVPKKKAGKTPTDRKVKKNPANTNA